MDKNTVNISGKICSSIRFSHESHNEKFYTFYISVKRQSGTIDVIPIIASDWLIDASRISLDTYVKINGQFRSFVTTQGKTILSVFATELECSEEVSEDENMIYIEGCICKAPTHRQTPLGRHITDILVAVDRPYQKTDYLPCICWGNSAIAMAEVKANTRISIVGRLQSREYQKRDVTKVAYEISVIQSILDI